MIEPSSVIDDQATFERPFRELATADEERRPPSETAAEIRQVQAKFTSVPIREYRPLLVRRIARDWLLAGRPVHEPFF